jgi:chitinase
MGRKKLSLAAFVAVAPLALFAANVTPAAADGNNEKPIVAAYFASWDVYGRGYQVKDIPV